MLKRFQFRVLFGASERTIMKTKLASIVAALFLVSSMFVSSVRADVGAAYDVVIYGGTSAAVISAVQVKKMGKTVVLVSPDKHLGGLSSGGLGMTDSGNRAVVGGLSREFYHCLWLHY